MSFSLLQIYTAVRNNGPQVSFGSTGGSGSTTFSVVAGGAGGSIDGSSGLYTPPAQTGIDVIQATDSASTPAVAVGSIHVCNPLMLVADIIKTSLGLAEGQVYLYQQKYNIPIDGSLYIAVGVNYCKPFGNRPKYVGGSTSFQAIQSVNMLMNINIHVLSRSMQALDRKEEVLTALSGPYAEQQMELNSFFIAPIPTSMPNVAAIDGMAIPYHFIINANLQYSQSLIGSPSYFNQFSLSVITDASAIVVSPGQPGPFRFIYAAAINAITSDLVWSVSTNAGSYEVLRGTESGSWPTSLGFTTNNQFIDGSVDPDTTYYYEVVAHNDVGSLPVASQAIIITPLPEIPGSFSILSCVGQPQAIAVNWSTSEFAISYDILRGSVSGSWPMTVASGLMMTTSYIDTTVIAGIEYFYQVVAVNNLGSQFATSEASATALLSEVTAGSFGSGRYLVYGTPADATDFPVNAAFTLAGWVNITSFASTGGFFSRYNNATTTGYLNYWQSDGTLHSEVDSNQNDYMATDTVDPVVISGSYRFIVIVVDGTQTAAGMLTYVNGSLVPVNITKDTLSGSARSNKSGAIGVNNNGSTNYADAIIDELSIWGSALTAGQVVQLYNGGTPTALTAMPFASSLLSWYRLENSVLIPPDTSSIIYDRAGSINAINNGVTFSTNIPS